MALRNPVSVSLDGQGTLSILDDKYFRILQIDRDGRVVRRLSVQPHDREHYEYWTETAVDSGGTLYAINVVYLVENELVEVTETRTETHTFDAEPMDFETPFAFELDYKHTTGHLFKDWGMLRVLSALFYVCSVFMMKRKDSKLA